ncbi:hypothetical protein B0T22DRAFT_447616 [Podospora appendiculata]|uniref:RNase MRP protein 1 RNA binding domain-containing protein n=1 Tax=Podospora appendiculata TaxID=314037 RepID=A0AAE0XG15_9PEZI|nr:hypothetical protein B0T22DRAFT_447616 [Podospora appendiculata]
MAPKTEAPSLLRGAAAASKPTTQDPKRPMEETMATSITSPAVVEQGLARLLPALELLERFHHRNKNQHRLSKWWAHADMLRRHLRKLAHALDAASSDTGSSKKQTRCSRRRPTRAELAALGARAAFLRRSVVPNAYDGFARLVADRQFAHLGLMLMGVLAQVDGALAPFAEDGAGQEEQQISGLAAVAGYADGGEKGSGGGGGGLEGGGAALPSHDFGVAVSRSALPKAAAGSGSATARSKAGNEVRRGKPSSSSSSSYLSEPKKRAQAVPSPPSPATGTDTNIATIITKTTTATAKKSLLPSIEPTEDDDDDENQTTSSRKPKKDNNHRLRKRPADGQEPEEARDEFDDIFGSLPKKKKKKKKEKETDSVAKPAKKTSKKKGGDEFDDIFNSLF